MVRSGKYDTKLDNADSEELSHLGPRLQCPYVCAEIGESVIIGFETRRETVRRGAGRRC